MIPVNYALNGAAPPTFVGDTYSFATGLEQLAQLNDLGPQHQSHVSADLRALAKRVREMAVDQEKQSARNPSGDVTPGDPGDILA